MVGLNIQNNGKRVKDSRNDQTTDLVWKSWNSLDEKSRSSSLMLIQEFTNYNLDDQTVT